ncbi:hypothetical protein [Secundilactobacillus kimchicus]|uniref:hypothetical protein n=1 Tax=Secundilactobacillus kimchicus TaxID=528209 RepID=UPI0024A9BCE0|nr:hypothetical protein [Secundilactobacillus kimchicus]
MAVNKLEELRKRGNFTPQNPFSESDSTQQNTHNKIEPDETAKYISAANQRKTLKVSPQTKSEIEELKRQLKMSFNYEVIQFLIDDYIETHLTAAEKKEF